MTMNVTDTKEDALYWEEATLDRPQAGTFTPEFYTEYAYFH